MLKKQDNTQISTETDDRQEEIILKNETRKDLEQFLMNKKAKSEDRDNQDLF